MGRWAPPRSQEEEGVATPTGRGRVRLRVGKAGAPGGGWVKADGDKWRGTLGGEVARLLASRAESCGIVCRKRGRRLFKKGVWVVRG